MVLKKHAKEYLENRTKPIVLDKIDDFCFTVWFLRVFFFVFLFYNSFCYHPDMLLKLHFLGAFNSS